MGNRKQRFAALVVTGALVLVAACSDGDGDSADPTTPPAEATTSTTEAPATDSLKLNQIQVIGTHNSFREAAPPEEYALLSALSEEQALTRAYSHRPVPEQLDDQGIRQFEFDVFADTQGGLYADPVLRRQAGLGPLDVPAMSEPGTKVLHEQDVDYHSVCPTLVMCLTEIREWSDANPTHVPVAVHIQFRDGPLIFNVPDQAVPEPWTAELMDRLEEEITSVFERDRMITPDDVRGDHATVNEAAVAGDWPTLGDSRGKVMFLMISGGVYRERYLEGHPNLEGRIMFTSGEPGEPDVAYVGVDDPLAEPGRTESLVSQGYLVRTRADTPNAEARLNDTTRRDAALAEGAHWVSTDHPAPDGARELYDTDYVVALPGGLRARCNPITAPTDCDDTQVEP